MFQGRLFMWWPATLWPVTGDEVRRAQFHERLRGYDPRLVDEWMNEVAAALDAGQPISHLVNIEGFGRRIRGYRMKDVDALLERLRQG